MWTGKVRDILVGKEEISECSFGDQLYLFLVPGIGSGIAAGALEMLLIWPWQMSKQSRVPSYYLLYLALPSAMYALIGIGAAVAALLLLRYILKVSPERAGADGYSLFSGLSFGSGLVLSIFSVGWLYRHGQKGALISLLGWPSLLLISMVVLILFLAWNRLLLMILSRRKRLALGILFISFFLTCVGSIALLGDFPGERKSADRGPSTGLADAADKDNIILITIDTQRADYIGCYGNSRIQTPTIDEIAEEGVRFKGCISQCPLTLPSHTSIMTATYPIYHGVRTNKGYVASQSLNTLAEALRGNGYQTAAFVSAFILDDRFGLDQGFDTYDGNFDRLHLSFISMFLDRSLFYRILSHAGYFEEDYLQRRAGETTDSAVTWLERHGEAPFFLWIHYFDPHGPWNPVKPYDTMYQSEPDADLDGEITVTTLIDRQNLTKRFVENVKLHYMGEISYTDRQIGNLREALAHLNLDGKTLIVLTADHGESFAENDFWGHGGVVNNPSIRIPLIFYRPGRLSGGRVVDGLSESIDIMPTILDYLGIEGPKEMQGMSLLPFMDGSRNLPDRTGYSEATASETQELRVWSLVTMKWKYVYSPAGGWGQLINREEDPAEERDMAHERPELAASMKSELLELVKTQSSPDSPGAENIDRETENALRALGYVR